ncbi:MAG: tetratricopeptide repeat protein [bacterium]
MSELGEVKRKVAEFVAKGDTKKAITELEQAVKEFPKEGSLFNKLGDLLIKVNRKNDALIVYEQGARVFKEETYFPNAIALCKKIIRLEKDRTTIYELLGELHKQLDQRGEAANYFLEYAERKIKANDLDAALETYNTIKELVPNNPKILETISAIYEKVGKKEEGEELLKEAHEIEDKQEKLREKIVVEEPQAEVEKEVEEEIEEVVKKPEVEEEVAEEETEEEKESDIPLEDFVSPEVAELLKDDEISAEEEEGVTETPAVLSEIDKTIELGELYLNLGSEEEAIDCFRSAANESWNNKNYDNAFDLNKRIADLRPFDLRSRQHLVEISKIKNDMDLQIEAMVDLAESLSRREAKSEARDLCKKILELDSENTKAQEMFSAFEQPQDYIDLGEVLRTELEDEKKSDSIQSIEGLISQFRREVFESIGEGDFRSRYDLGVAYKGMGLYQEAIEEFEIAAKDPELRLKAYEMIGSCFLERGKADDAVKILGAGLKITNRPAREYFGIHFLLGNCYEKMKKMKEALRSYMYAYKIDKTVPDLARRINDLKNKYLAETKKKGRKIVTKPPAKAKPESIKTAKVRAKKSKITYL